MEAPYSYSNSGRALYAKGIIVVSLSALLVMALRGPVQATGTAGGYDSR